VDAIRYRHSKHNIKVKLAEKNHTHFSLTNAHWQVTCGRKMAASCQSEKLIKVMGLQPAIDLLAQHSSKVSTSAEYLTHLRARLATMETMKKYVNAKAPHRWGFECYRKEQLAAHQLSKDLKLGVVLDLLFSFTKVTEALAPPPMDIPHPTSAYAGCCLVQHPRDSFERVSVFTTERLLPFSDERLPQDSIGYEACDGQTVHFVPDAAFTRCLGCLCHPGHLRVPAPGKDTFLTVYVRNNNTEWSPPLRGMRDP
jgi:hypothetical protein